METRFVALANWRENHLAERTCVARRVALCEWTPVIVMVAKARTTLVACLAAPAAALARRPKLEPKSAGQSGRKAGRRRQRPAPLPRSPTPALPRAAPATAGNGGMRGGGMRGGGYSRSYSAAPRLLAGRYSHVRRRRW